MSEQKRSKQELLDAIKKLKAGGDSGTFLTDIGAGVAGAVGGGAAAFAFGGTTATALFGLVAVPVAAPLAVIAGGTILGGAALFGVKRALMDGTYHEGKKSEIIRQMKDELHEIKRKERGNSVKKGDKTKFHIFLEQPIKLDLITSDLAQKLMEQVEKGLMPISEAYEMVGAILAEERGLPPAAQA